MPFLSPEGESLRVEPNFITKNGKLLLWIGVIIVVVGMLFVVFAGSRFYSNADNALGIAHEAYEQGLTTLKYEATIENLHGMVGSQIYTYLGFLITLVGTLLAVIGVYGRILAQVDDELSYYKLTHVLRSDK